jgi:electron transfer flavoprotein alpha subunit
VSARETPRVAVVLDGTAGDAERQARALGGFLREGLRLHADAPLVAATHLFHADAAAAERLLELAPTSEVRLIRTPALRSDLMTAALAAFETGGGAELFVRLAARSGGAVLTDVLNVEAVGSRLTCRRRVYSNHLTGLFDLGPRPWCITLDASWCDASPAAPIEHVVQTVAELHEDDFSASGPLANVELLEQPATGDLEAAKCLVVAGRGAGSRGGVERVAAAAARMGAAFGATRPVVMNGWAPPDRQIGVSGARSSSDVCLTVGASGAPAFLWGIERAGFIAAVDTDEHAAIAGEADALVIDDGVAVIEALAEIVARERP